MRPCPRFPLAFVWFMALITLMGLMPCQNSEPTVDHLALARKMADEITATEAENKYSSPEWEKVSSELEMIEEGHRDYDEAQTWLKEIRKARQARLFETQERDGGAVAYKVPTHSGGGAKEPLTSIGFEPPPDSIDVDAIARGVKSGGASSSKGSSKASSGSSATGGGSKSVTIYTTSWCGVCKSAKKYMRSKGISFTERDVEKDPAAAAAKEKRAPGTGVPVIVVGSEMLVGFDESALDRMLAR